MTIMDRGAMALGAYKKTVAAGRCAVFDGVRPSHSSTICTLKANHGGEHSFEPIIRVLLAEARSHS